MGQTVNRLKANRVLEGQPCGWCSSALTFGEDAALCEGCTTAHHAKCWEGKGGCSSQGCVNAPLKQLAPQPEQQPFAPPGKMNCPNCHLEIPSTSIRCEYCNVGVVSADGLYRGPTQTAPGAVASLVFGILAFFICGIIFGVVAIQKADEAKTAIAADPSLTGEGMATAGKVLGITALVIWGLGIVLRVANAAL